MMVAPKVVLAPVLALFALGLSAATTVPTAIEVGAHFKRFGLTDTTTTNDLLASAYYWLGAPAAAAAAPLLERFGAGNVAMGSSIGILVAALVLIVAVQAQSSATIIVAQIILGIAGELHTNVFFAFLTRWYGSGATLWYAGFTTCHSIGKIFTLLLLPAVAAAQGLRDAVLLLAVIQLFMVFVTNILNVFTEQVEVKSEVRAERIGRPEVLNPRRALGLITLNAWILSTAAGFHIAALALFTLFGPSAWQSLYHLAPHGSDTASVTSTAASCFGAIATGLVIEYRYRPREMLLATSTGVLIVVAVLANSSSVPIMLLISLFGCFAGACHAVLMTVLPNVLPRYSHILYSLATTIGASVTVLTVLPLNAMLRANELPPCPPPQTPRPGSSHTAAPGATPFPCTTDHLPTPEAFQVVLNMIVLFVGISWLLIIIAVVVDVRGDRRLGRRVAGDSDAAVIEQEVELEDVLVRRSVILGGDPTSYGGTGPS